MSLYVRGLHSPTLPTATIWTFISLYWFYFYNATVTFPWIITLFSFEKRASSYINNFLFKLCENEISVVTGSELNVMLYLTVSRCDNFLLICIQVINQNTIFFWSVIFFFFRKSEFSRLNAPKIWGLLCDAGYLVWYAPVGRSLKEVCFTWSWTFQERLGGLSFSITIVNATRWHWTMRHMKNK